VLDMGPAAQVDESRAAGEGRVLLGLGRRVLVGADLTAGAGAGHGVGRGVVDDLQLEAVPGEDGPGVGGRDLVAQERLVLVDDLAHAGVDAIEVVGREGGPVRQVEVVVEAVLDRRADAERGVGEQVEHRLGQHVGGRVADRVQALLAVGGDDGHAVAVGQLGRQVALLAVDLGDHRRLGQPGADALRQAERSRAGRERTLRSVGQGDVDLGHGCRGYRAAPTAPACVAARSACRW
jgi:hypothetical protein